MNATTEADGAVDGYSLTYQLQSYCLFCCAMAQLRDSLHPHGISLRSEARLPDIPRIHETSELKMGPYTPSLSAPRLHGHPPRSSAAPKKGFQTRRGSPFIKRIPIASFYQGATRCRCVFFLSFFWITGLEVSACFAGEGQR